MAQLALKITETVNYSITIDAEDSGLLASAREDGYTGTTGEELATFLIEHYNDDSLDVTVSNLMGDLASGQDREGAALTDLGVTDRELTEAAPAA